MSRDKYRLLKDRFEHKAGIVVYQFAGHDYGCARDDTMETGENHTSVTLDKDGGYPFFTVPCTDLEAIR